MGRAARIGIVSGGLIAVAALLSFDLGHSYERWLLLAAAAAPLVLVARYLLDRVYDDRLATMLAGLGADGPVDTVRDVLRRTLGDPGLEIVYTQVGRGSWITGLGEPATRPAGSARRTFTPIDRDGKPIAGLVHDRALLRHPRRLRAAVGVASLALDNERLRAQLRADLLEAHAARARVIDAGDRELRRLERNLHDGAQQRLVGLALMFRLAGRRVEGDPELAALLGDATRELSDAISELRELSRGIHPAIVDDTGLRGALESLVERPGVPVDLQVDLPGRMPEVVEVAAYYLVAEALTNVNKHASATRVSVRARTRDDVLHVEVTDDGVGGAEPSSGSGLQGLADRIRALGGQFGIDSSPASGTVVSAALPLVQNVRTEAEQRRRTALRWFVHENWEMPGEVVDQITDEDNLIAGKVMLLAGGGNARITEREREWLIGYLTAARDADWVIEAVTAYDDSDSLQGLMQLPGIPETVRGMLYDAIRMCSSDGPLTPEELGHLERSAAELGVTRDELDELRAIVEADAGLRRRRFNAIAAPVLPRGPSTAG